MLLFISAVVTSWDAHLNPDTKPRKEAGGAFWDGKKKANVGFLLEHHSTSHGFGPSGM